MPTPHKKLANQRKHLTKAERAARQAAEHGLERETRVYLRCPDWLGEDARKVWKETVRRARALELLDTIDTELLAIYADTVARYRESSKLLALRTDDGAPVATDEQVKQAQAWARIITTYAEKLGLSPAARARLARKRAVEQPPDDLEQLLSEAADAENWKGDG